jgi:hypothetical protein
MTWSPPSQLVPERCWGAAGERAHCSDSEATVALSRETGAAGPRVGAGDGFGPLQRQAVVTFVREPARSRGHDFPAGAWSVGGALFRRERVFASTARVVT